MWHICQGAFIEAILKTRQKISQSLEIALFCCLPSSTRSPRRATFTKRTSQMSASLSSTIIKGESVGMVTFSAKWGGSVAKDSSHGNFHEKWGTSLKKTHTICNDLYCSFWHIRQIDLGHTFFFFPLIAHRMNYNYRDDKGFCASSACVNHYTQVIIMRIIICMEAGEE